MKVSWGDEMKDSRNSGGQVAKRAQIMQAEIGEWGNLKHSLWSLDHSVLIKVGRLPSAQNFEHITMRMLHWL